MKNTPNTDEGSMISRARQFAAQAHASIDQRRKYTNAPYIVHPAAVAKLVASVTQDEAMICAAWLHDVVEDTPVTLDTIRMKFGEDIADLVSDLTDVSTPKDGNRRQRKQIDREHTRQACARAKTIKLADLIDNTCSITRYDPHFAETYMAEKKKLLTVLQEGDPELLNEVTRLVDAYYNHPDRNPAQAGTLKLISTHKVRNLCRLPQSDNKLRPQHEN